MKREIDSPELINVFLQPERSSSTRLLGKFWQTYDISSLFRSVQPKLSSERLRKVTVKPGERSLEHPFERPTFSKS